jgi:hypothetical protein
MVRLKYLLNFKPLVITCFAINIEEIKLLYKVLYIVSGKDYFTKFVSIDQHRIVCKQVKEKGFAIRLPNLFIIVQLT